MKSLDDLDELVKHVIEFPYPDLIKPLMNLRAQFVLDVAGVMAGRVQVVLPEPGEPE